MPNNTNSLINKGSASAGNADDHGSLWQDLFGDKGGMPLLGIGIFLILINAVAFFAIDIRPSAWLFYLDMRFWPIHVSIFLWATAIWLVAESTESVEEYLPIIRVSMVICILLVVVFWLQTVRPSSQGHLLWFHLIAVAAVFCAVRSLLLLYDYRYGEESINMEEAQWFWGLSGFLFVVLIIIGLMCIIHIKVPAHPGMDSFGSDSISLFASCRNGLQTLIRSGSGSLAIRTFGFLIFATSIAFIYVVSKWALIFLLKMRGE